MTTQDAASTLAARLLTLSDCAAAAVTVADQRGDREAGMYARGLRDAYATAAMFAEGR